MSAALTPAAAPRRAPEPRAAYRAYRARTHRLSLDGVPPIVPTPEFRDTRAAVLALWDATMSGDP